MKLSNYFSGILLSPLFFSGCSSVEIESLPNIVILLADDLGYNDLTSYRSENKSSGRTPGCRTPNIDDLAAKGMMFTNFYCGAAVSSPSRAALITGRNATRTGIYNYIPRDSPMHLRNG